MALEKIEIIKDGKIKYVEVGAFNCLLLDIKRAIYDGVDPGYINDNETHRAVQMMAMNQFSTKLSSVPIVEVYGMKCYNVDRLIRLVRRTKRLIRDGVEPEYWCPDQTWRIQAMLAINKIGACLRRDESDERLKERNMFPLDVAVREYKAGKREVKIPPRFTLCRINGEKNECFFAGIVNEMVLTTVSPSFAEWFVNREEAFEKIKEISDEFGTTESNWHIADMYSMMSPANKFLRQLFGVDEGIETDV